MAKEAKKAMGKEKKEKLTLFITSSSEAKERQILSHFVIELQKHYEVKPWDEVFEIGSITIDQLLKLTQEIDLALCLFTKDDKTIKKGENKLSVRDNVLFEYALFLSVLGKKRVLIGAEEGADTPSDINGVTVSKFTTDNIEHSISISCGEIEKAWNDLTPKKRDIEVEFSNIGTEFDDKGMGIKGAIKYYDEYVRNIVNFLQRYANDSNQKMDKPFYFDSSRASLISYKEGLDSVKNKFWTSTFLSSGFWLQNEASIVESNRNLLSRLSAHPDSVRRLFMIECDAFKKVEQITNEIIHYKKENDHTSIQKKLADIRKMKNKIQDLINAGACVKVVHDSDGLYEGLVAQIDFDPNDSEIAIYDDRRLDVFSGGSSGNINGVRIYSEAIGDFQGILRSANDYVSSLWNDAQEFSVFIEALEKSCNRALNRIDYESNWLAKYQYGLNSDDENLKILEFARVREVLTREEKWGNIKRFLDIGTCTGRYVVGLKDAVSPKGTILGVDEDEDCYHFAKSYIAKQAKDDKRIDILQADFTSNNFPEMGRFDLITCMLGTLSHFGWDRNGDTLEDSLQSSLVRMRKYLSRDGVLILGTWSNFAIDNLNMLSIYSKNDRNLLSKWTPSADETENRLSKAGLWITEKVTPEPRLNMYFCTHVKH